MYQVFLRWRLLNKHRGLLKILSLDFCCMPKFTTCYKLHTGLVEFTLYFYFQIQRIRNRSTLRKQFGGKQYAYGCSFLSRTCASCTLTLHCSRHRLGLTRCFVAKTNSLTVLSACVPSALTSAPSSMISVQSTAQVQRLPLFIARRSNASAVLRVIILSVRLHVRLSHACFRQTERTYCRYFDIIDTTWKGNYSI